MIKFFRKRLLFIISLVLCAVVGGWGMLFPDNLGGLASGLTAAAFDALGWFFMLSVTAFLGICIWLALSRFGKLKLGQPDDQPEFSTLSWMAMLFAAGMGVGLLFWGVAEPVMHFSSPPVLRGGSPEAARQAMVLTNFHWGLHAWAVYAIAGLVLAYFGFRRGTPNLPGAPLRSVFSGRWVPFVAGGADLIGVMAVAIGVAGSLGMGILQIQAGLHVLTGLSADSLAVSTGILLVLTAAYLVSASTGLDKGIKILSNMNILIAIALMLFLLIAGPTAFLLDGFVTAIGDYSSSLISISLRTFPYRDLGEWTTSWTLTYFIWWIAWAPFVGVFIARISRGRTIREFVAGVLLAPTLFSILWFAVFGGSAIYQDLWGLGGISELVNEDVTVAVFSLFERYPLSGLLGWTAVVLVFVFLVTSADSATFVLGMLTSHGTPNPSTTRKISWGLLLAALSAALVFTGNIDALRAVVVSGAVPFAFVMLLQIVAFVRALREEPEEAEDETESPVVEGSGAEVRP